MLGYPDLFRTVFVFIKKLYIWKKAYICIYEASLMNEY